MSKALEKNDESRHHDGFICACPCVLTLRNIGPVHDGCSLNQCVRYKKKHLRYIILAERESLSTVDEVAFFVHLGARVEPHV